MLINIDIKEKLIGNKELYKNFSLALNENEKVALIGRNGVGKTTLFKMIEGEDKDYDGIIDIKKGTQIVVTKQEHFMEESITPLEYILSHIQDYTSLKEIIDTYPAHMEGDMDKINIYSNALNRFGDLGYYQIEDKIIRSLESYKVSFDKVLSPLVNLSGGEKRFVELVKVMYSACDIALIDEPTNHMDYIGKADFIEWIRECKHAVLTITHDRDVLRYVDKIVEVRDKTSFIFPGNYDSYIKQNSIKTIGTIKSYEESVKTLEKLEKQIANVRPRVNMGSKSARILMDRFQREYNEIKLKLKRPSIWIDQDSVEKFNKKIVAKYEKYKDKNISIKDNNENESKKNLLDIRNLSIGYKEPLFEDINFSLVSGDRLMIKGRNGVGKSTLIKTIISTINNTPLSANIFKGNINFSDKIKLGIYEQEIDKYYLNQKLGDAIIDVYFKNKLEISTDKLNLILRQYLFDQFRDKELTINNLSGGQKARFQIIKMLSNNPNLLILDEPTNHLDLPSIEELEKSLIKFNGAILYVSHDSYFIEKLKGDTIEIGNNK